MNITHLSPRPTDHVSVFTLLQLPKPCEIQGLVAYRTPEGKNITALRIVRWVDGVATVSLAATDDGRILV